MKSREEHIAFDMNYCEHYQQAKKGGGMECAKGCDLAQVQHVPVGERGMKWGPCIEGHTLVDPKSHCPHWERRSRERAENRADQIERSIARLTKVMPFVATWRAKPPKGKAEVVACPVCNGRLHLSQAAYNGHVHGRCETKDCVSWIE